MSKKMMLLALAVAALFALPAAASAQEAHISGITNFTGHAGAGSLAATGEPTIKCTTSTTTGKFDTGSTTTGSIELDFTGCEAEFGPFKFACNTSGSPSKTIKSSGTFHVITINSKPGLLVTPVNTTIICAGFSNTTVSGSIIGTITSPACGASSKTLTAVFNSSGGPTQEHITYTGVKYDLSATTSGGSPVTAGLTSGTVTLTSATAGTLECT